MCDIGVPAIKLVQCTIAQRLFLLNQWKFLARFENHVRSQTISHPNVGVYDFFKF